MSMPSPSPRAGRNGWLIALLLVLLLAVAAFLYVLMLANAARQTAGGGEARMGDAFEALYVTAWLWIVLGVLLVVGGVGSPMPR